MYLVPAPDDDDADDGFGEDFDENFDPDAPTLTPRQCHVVAQVARELADTVFADTHLLGDRPVQPSSDAVVLAEFPECTWAQDATWRRTMARAFDDLAADTAAGTDPEPRCTGEEMALHLIIDRARTASTSGRFTAELWFPTIGRMNPSLEVGRIVTERNLAGGTRLYGVGNH